MTTKVEAAAIAVAAGVPTLVTSATLAGEALSGADVGTWFAVPAARRARRSTRQLWLAHAAAPAGRLVLDDGAVRAVRQNRSSLLPAGVVDVSGRFRAGDPVDLVDGKGHAVARGLVNYSSEELPDMLGRSTRELARQWGPAYEREVVHRDHLVLLGR
jgi:glutamate 5-kinase